MNKTPENIAQLIIAALVVLGGMSLLHIGIQIDPEGEIHETVLVAFGEAATFAPDLEKPLDLTFVATCGAFPLHLPPTRIWLFTCGALLRYARTPSPSGDD